MRVIVLGLGVQGQKRCRIAGSDVVATVDPVHGEAQYRSLDMVPFDSFDSAILSVPDAPKLDLIERLLDAGKHVMVEKPLLTANGAALERLAALAQEQGVTCYTAYNHRFEPHIVTAKEMLERGEIGPVYRARLFYGNGTARDVRNSPWRDRDGGVLTDLGSHLLDLLLYFFDALPDSLTVWAAKRFENAAFDHVVCGARGERLIELEMSLLSWRNHFVAEFYGEAGSLHIESLCKWGPSTLTLRRRILPSGRPTEESRVLTQPDPTWGAEYRHFKKLCETGDSNLVHDIRINRMLQKLLAEA
jgi:scyllo-inositol 2-dehydrogenase (NADP+)